MSKRYRNTGKTKIMLSYIIAARWSNLGDLKTVKPKKNKPKGQIDIDKSVHF